MESEVNWKRATKKKTTWMNVSLVCLFRGVNLWNIPATMIIFRVNKWILLYYNVVNMNFHYWMIIVAEMFHKLTPGNIQTSETFIQFVWFFSSLFFMHQQGTILTQNWLLCTFFMLQAFSVFSSELHFSLKYLSSVPQKLTVKV